MYSHFEMLATAAVMLGRVHMYIHVCKYICVYLYIYIHVYVCIKVNRYVYVRTYVTGTGPGMLAVAAVMLVRVR